MRKIFRKAAAPAALVLGLGVAATAMEAVHDPIPDLSAQAAAPSALVAPRAAQQPATADPGSLSGAFRAASHEALPAVVYVQVEMAPRAVSQQGPNPFQGTPFEQFFGGPGGPQAAPHAQMASGSGFIVSPDGYILTNNHVVENASRVSVRLTDKREFDARVVGRDPNTDVAVLKIDGKELPTVQLGSSESLQVGDWVLALGYPMSLGETVTAGIVSAKGKSIGIMQQNDDAKAPLEHFIQTDAAINPGNSGGPLINLDGQVVGINSAIASPTGAYSGYGFAVPIAIARRVAEDLMRDGEVHRPKLGVEIKDVQPADVDVFGLEDANGAVVATVPAGPAKDAGIRLGDVIVAVDGTPVQDTGDLMERIALRRPGERVRLDIVRYGKPEQVTVKLGEFATGSAPTRSAAADAPDALGRLGFAVTPMNPQLAQQLGLRPDADGLVITRVDPMGPAPRNLTGLRLQSINGHPVRSLSELRKAAGGLGAGATVSIVGLMPDGNSTIVNYRLHG